MNTYTVTLDGVLGVKLGRRLALRKCAWGALGLRNEFNKFCGVYNTYEEFDEKTKAFVREKGLRVISERPIVRVKGDRYVVDVIYTITW